MFETHTNYCLTLQHILLNQNNLILEQLVKATKSLS